jgi:sterol desaturase/sphingolipid hydroxylase (fatty acid hydroxylase superfamily)
VVKVRVRTRSRAAQEGQVALMDFQTAIIVALPSVFFLLMASEALIKTGRDMPKIRYWRVIGLAGLLVSLACNAVLPLAIVPILPATGPFDLTGWGWWGALPTVMLTTFLTYWSHRIQHRFDFLWRLGHQLHHGVARVDIASAMIFHPIDLAVQVTMTLLAAVILGVSANVAALAGGLGFFIAVFQHWNVATPRWANWIIQRPEAHMLHHERNIHARNYGDMPIWDMIFGTYENPAQADVKIGFAPDCTRRWLAMIACIDVNKGRGRDKL